MSPTSYRTAPPRVVKTPYGTERNGLIATSHSSPIGSHDRCTVATMSNLTGPFDTGKLARIAPGSVTVTIARTIAPGKGDAFVIWCDEMLAAVQQSPGCLGATVLHPGVDSDAYQMVFRFIDALHLRRWERSQRREELLSQVDEMILTERITVTAGTDEFFIAQGNSDRHRTKYGKFVADIAWVYPMSLIITVVLAPLIASMTLWQRVLVTTLFFAVTKKFGLGPMRRYWRRRHMLPQNSTQR